MWIYWKIWIIIKKVSIDSFAMKFIKQIKFKKFQKLKIEQFSRQRH